MLVTTTFEVEGQKIAKYLGITWGISVRSRPSFMRFWTNWQTSIGGRIGSYAKLTNLTREEAFNDMLQRAKKSGADAVVGFHFGTTELDAGITEIIAYGTAVKFEQRIQ